MERSREKEIPVAPITRILRKEGAERVSDEAAVYLRDFIEEVARYIAKEAVSLARHSNRKTVTRRDVEYVAKKIHSRLYVF